MGGNEEPETPTLFEVIVFFDQKGFEVKFAESFFKEYSERNWKGKRGIQVKNWRTKALDWMWQRQRTRPYLRSKSKLMVF